MKRIILLITTFILFTNYCKSQIDSIAITGNYIGQSMTELLVMTIEVKQNHTSIPKPFLKINWNNSDTELLLSHLPSYLKQTYLIK